MASVEVIPALADAIESRRAQLGLSPTELAERAGVSVPGLAPLRRGVRRAYQDRLTVGVEDALVWPRGTIRSILGGGSGPDLSELPIPHTTVTTLLSEVSELRHRVELLEVAVEALKASMATPREFGIAARGGSKTGLPGRATSTRHRPSPPAEDGEHIDDGSQDE